MNDNDLYLLAELKGQGFLTSRDFSNRGMNAGRAFSRLITAGLVRQEYDQFNRTNIYRISEKGKEFLRATKEPEPIKEAGEANPSPSPKMEARA